ncbi:MAG: D-alanyl-D-alanine carboxypeptidase/D-alanyl-D-alanine endopeptidase [Candidatus Sumerlaeaceae bacterium]
MFSFKLYGSNVNLRRFATCSVVRLLALLLLFASVGDASAATTKTSKAKSSGKTKAAVSKAQTKKPSTESTSKSKTRNPDDDDADDSGSKTAHVEVLTSTTPANVASILEPIVRASAAASYWGVKVVLQQTGQTIFEYNPDAAFIPASNRKLFTGALALDQLGPDFRFRSYLYRTGEVDSGGTLNGNLVLKPSGDPTFSKTMYNSANSDWVFRDWAKKVSDAGIKYVRGDLLIDCSDWDMGDLYPQGWPARVMQDNYAPQTSPLTLNENLMTVIVNPGEKGKSGVITFSPPAPGYPVINQTVTGAKGGVSVRRPIGGGAIAVSGGANKAGQGAELPCDNPTLFAAANFRHHLKLLNIGVQGSVRIISAKNMVPGWNDSTLLAAVESPPLSEIVRHMMKRSDNHMAEQVYVAVSAHKLGRGGYRASRKLEDNLLQRAGIRPADVQAFDGCGLSEANKVSPNQTCKLLTFMLTHPSAQHFFDSMAISGRDGTLRGRMNSERLRERVHAKTGTINGVKCLSGYLLVDPQHTLAFSFLVNKARGGSPSGTQDRLCSVLAGLQF